MSHISQLSTLLSLLQPANPPSINIRLNSSYCMRQGMKMVFTNSYVEWLLENHPDALPEHTLPEPVIAEEPQQHSTSIRHVGNSLSCQNVVKEPRPLSTHA